MRWSVGTILEKMWTATEGGDAKGGPPPWPRRCRNTSERNETWQLFPYECSGKIAPVMTSSEHEHEPNRPTNAEL